MAGELVLDASSLAHLLVFADEQGGPLDGLTWPDPLTLLAPDIALGETANALRQLVLRGTLAPDAADSGIADLRDLHIAVVSTLHLLDSAWQLRHRLTIFDALYVALASSLRIPLVTEDRRLRATAATLDVSTFSVTDPALHDLIARWAAISG